MKTTIEIPDALLKEAQSYARDQGVTLRSLVEQGLRNILATRHARAAFTLADKSVTGRGLQPEFADASWTALRDAAYGGTQ